VTERLAYTPAEAAEALGVSEAWVLYHLKDGTLPGVRIGRRWFVHAESLDRLLSGEDSAEVRRWRRSAF